MKRRSIQPREPNPETQRCLARLEDLPDDQIDLSDAPELTPQQAATAFRPGLYRPIKLPVTMRMDADVLDWFKRQAGNTPYQTEINRVLREHMTQSAKLHIGKKSA